MEKAELLYRIIELICLLIPLGTIIYKLGKTSEKITEHDRRITQCEAREADIDNDTERSLTSIMSMLSDIKISIARLEERINKQPINKQPTKLSKQTKETNETE